MDLTLSKKTKVKQSKRSGEGVTAYVTEHTPTQQTHLFQALFTVALLYIGTRIGWAPTVPLLAIS